MLYQAPEHIQTAQTPSRQKPKAQIPKGGTDTKCGKFMQDRLVSK